MEYNWWDDRTLELDNNPCIGCEDYQDNHCISNGGCGKIDKEEDNESRR